MSAEERSGEMNSYGMSTDRKMFTKMLMVMLMTCLEIGEQIRVHTRSTNVFAWDLHENDQMCAQHRFASNY